MKNFLKKVLLLSVLKHNSFVDPTRRQFFKNNSVEKIEFLSLKNYSTINENIFTFFVNFE